jgi:hypothetical protein
MNIVNKQTNHPEDYCHRCGGKNYCWSAPSPLWNMVMRDNQQLEANGWGIICPMCFMELYENKFGEAIFTIVPMSTFNNNDIGESLLNQK